MSAEQEGSIYALLKDVENNSHQTWVSKENDASIGKVRYLLHYIEPVYLRDRCVDVLERFVKDQSLQAVAVVNVDQHAVGIIDRGKIGDIFLKPFV